MLKSVSTHDTPQVPSQQEISASPSPPNADLQPQSQSVIAQWLVWLGLVIGLGLLVTALGVAWYPLGPSVDKTTEHGAISTIELAGKQIPLPKYPWVVASAGREVQNLPSGPTVVENQLLLGVKKADVAAFVLIRTNVAPAVGGWGISQDCKNPDYPFTAIYEQQNNHYSCSFVGDFKTTGPDAASWSMAEKFATQQQWQMPKQWIVVGMRLADRIDVVDIRYGFDPQAMRGAELLTNGIDTTEVAADTIHKASMQALIKWQEGAFYLAERGFRRQLDHEMPLLMPKLVASDAAALPLVVNSRLRQLADLHANGWLSRTEFEAQSALIKDAYMPKTDLTVDIWSLGALKTAGHTTQTLFWMWGVNYLFLGDVYLAGGLALTKAVISPIRYYLEETAWNTWGPRRNPTLPVVDFAPEADR